MGFYGLSFNASSHDESRAVDSISHISGNYSWVVKVTFNENIFKVWIIKVII